MKRENRWAVEELQVVAADMQDVSEMEFEEVPDLRPSVKKFSSRVAEAAARLKQLLCQTEEDVLNSARWILLFDTPGVHYEFEDGQYLLYQDVVHNGKKIGRRLLGRGPELVKLIDRQLGRDIG